MVKTILYIFTSKHWFRKSTIFPFGILSSKSILSFWVRHSIWTMKIWKCQKMLNEMCFKLFLHFDNFLFEIFARLKRPYKCIEVEIALKGISNWFNKNREGIFYNNPLWFSKDKQAVIHYWWNGSFFILLIFSMQKIERKQS